MKAALGSHWTGRFFLRLLLMLIVDVEVFRDYFLCMFKDIKSGRSAAFEMFDGQPFDATRVSDLMREYVTVGFNSNSYDLFVIAHALGGATPVDLKALSDAIIKSNLPAWRVARDWQIRVPQQWDHIDLIEVAPGQASLKIYGGRLHCPTMQELPIDPNASISPEQREELRRYCENDLDTTEALFRKLEGAIKLRADMSKQYGGIDLRSKSDAQIAEAVIKHELVEMTGKEYRPSKAEVGGTVRYKDPLIVGFRDAGLMEIFERILKTGFPIGANGAVRMPEWLAQQKIRIGQTDYQMGIGGLHSCEKAQSIVAGPEQILADFDVASYYPSIILKLRLAPSSMGGDFLKVYQSIVTRRLQAKAAGDKLIADTLKIVVNGSFGKLGSMYSALYAPELMIQTTITGQLCLLMLIERLEMAGMRVVSANTDGIVVLADKRREAAIDEITFDWMIDTSFELERSNYRALHSRDVNNYIAVKLDGSTKRKGVYAEPGLSKNPEFTIVADAMAAFLSISKPVEETIRLCDDVTKFVSIRRVEGGGVWRGAYLGKAVRFYYSTGVNRNEQISYAKNRNKVPKTDGARPVMTLPRALPDDVDFDRYIDLAREGLKDMGIGHGRLL
jgi:hypothetical protein